MTKINDQPAVSVIVPCLDHAMELDRCLQSLSNQCRANLCEIIVVDSSSNDRAAAVALRHFGVRLYRSERRLMPGDARNLGARKATGKFLAFIDADCVAEPNWITALHAALETGHHTVGGPVLQGERWKPVALIDNLMQFVDLHPLRPPGTASLLPSCNLAISKENFDTIGGFPELELAAGEDVLFCAKARSHWAEGLYFEPAMRVRHFGRSSLREFWLHQVFFGYCRGLYALELRPAHRSLGRKWIFAPAVAIKRLSYLLSRAAGHPASLLRMVVLLPLLLVGVAAWCVGFRRGCIEGGPMQSVI